jgi:hypothetical protein
MSLPIGPFSSKVTTLHFYFYPPTFSISFSFFQIQTRIQTSNHSYENKVMNKCSQERNKFFYDTNKCFEN